MRVLLDANLPRDLARLLTGHAAHSIHQRRRSDLDDGPLLDACAGEYDALVTMDQSLRFQQNLRGRPIAVVLVHAHSNRLEHLQPLVPAMLEAIPHAPPGEITHVGV
jgi:predicted nuclease of predicted toxin-antitoxin system